MRILKLQASGSIQMYLTPFQNIYKIRNVTVNPHNPVWHSRHVLYIHYIQ